MRRAYGQEFGNAEVAARYGLDRTFVIDVPAGTDTEAMAAAFAEFKDQIEYAEVDAIGGVAEFIPNDTDFWRQYGLHNIGETGGLVDADIDAPEAWDIHTGDPGTVTVAIVDSGVNRHTEYRDRMVPGINTEDPSNPDLTTDGCSSHGTHVAGIVAAEGNNGVNVAGVTWGAKIMPVRVLDGCVGFELAAANGVIWAVDHGADIINMSLQYPTGTATFRNAVNYAHDNGVLVVSAAGNDDFCDPGVVCAPARFTNAMAVSATTDNDEFATVSNTTWPNWSSNYGDEIDVCAPGDAIHSTMWISGHGDKNGTSMATPHVTGLAALIKSYVPELTHDEIRAIITATVDDLGPEGWDDHYGHGRINAYKALVAAGPTQIVASSPPDGEIDARQPSRPDGSSPAGWQWVDLTFGGEVSQIAELAIEDFAVTQEGGGAAAPPVVAVLPVEGQERVVRVILGEKISVKAWTILTHIGSGTSVHLGYLPGDVNADGTSAPADILRVIDALNGVVELPIWSVDVDRSGVAAPPDILRVIDLLNGAGTYEPFLNATLP
ncbi:MAG: S8 family serine peptidase [Phycisphaerales bacterium]|nr:MAG: S8 family serine peptidase [Phycisphaerales bacterium]